MDSKELKRKWDELHNNPSARKLLRPEIADSWERSYRYGVNRMMRKNPYIATEPEIRAALDKSGYLMHVARPVMEQLKEFVSGTGFIVALLDPEFMGLKAIGDDEAIKWARSMHLVDGGFWSENLVGTNGAMLALMMAKPLSVFGYEHFCLFAHGGASSSAPVFDGDKMIGALNLTAPFDKVGIHTLGMVVAAVKHIESNIVKERVSKFYQNTINSISEGLLVVKGDGEILCVNNTCTGILRANSCSLAGRNLFDLMEQCPENRYFINLVTRGRNVTDETVNLIFGKDRVRCNISCNPMDDQDCYTVVLRESYKVNRLVRNWIGGNAKITFDDIVSKDPKFKQILTGARAAASSDSNVLITGESGTGKDLLAQAMHNASPRRDNPFVAINCAALPRDLIASELFGYDDGAFTGARKGGNIGKFELADQGTIFLDEIGDMPLDLQSALLRVIEEKRVIRLGGKKLIPVNVRIIAATNKNLELEMERKALRPDLYYRLGVIRFNLPPLHERREDIPVLVDYFVSRTCKKLHKPVIRSTSEIMEAFMNYAWPGNVREMQNVIEAAIQLSPTNELDMATIRENLKLSQEYGMHSLPELIIEGKDKSQKWSLDDLERRYILECLERHGHNKAQTARALGIQRGTLYNRLREYGIS